MQECRREEIVTTGFANIKGQDDAVRILTQWVERQQVPTCTIFAGPDGVGKGFTAEIFARILSCENRNACGMCEACLANRFGEGLLRIEINEIFSEKNLSNKTAALKERLSVADRRRVVPYFVVILSRAERMNPSMQAALLKRVEEPPPGVHFILLASSPEALLPTIRSRSHVVRFAPLSTEVIAEILEVTKGSTEYRLLKSADGSLSRARNLLKKYGTGEKIEEEFWKWGTKRGGKRAELQEFLEDAIPVLAQLHPSWKEPLLDFARAVDSNANVPLSFSVLKDRIG